MNFFKKRVIVGGMVLLGLGTLVAMNDQTPDDEDFLTSGSIDTELAKQNFGEKIVIVETQITLPKTAKLVLNIPRLGLVECTPMLDSKGVVRGFESLFPKVPLDWGLFKIEKGLFQIAGGKISYNAYVSILGKRATVGLKDFSLVEKEAEKIADAAKKGKPMQVYKLTLGIEFIEGALSLELAPGKTVAIKNLDVSIEEQKGVTFSFMSDVFGQRISLDGDLDIQKKEFMIKGVVHARPLIELIPDLKGTVLDGLSTDGMFFYRSFIRSLTAEEKVRGVEQKSFIFRGNLKRGEADDTQPVPLLGLTLQEATILLDTTKKQAYVSGKSKVLDLDIQAYFAVFYGAKKGVKFAAELAQSTKEWRPFKESSAQPLKDILVTNLKAGVRAQYIAAAEGKKEPVEKEPSPKESESKPEDKPLPPEDKPLPDLATITFAGTRPGEDTKAVQPIAQKRGTGPKKASQVAA